MHPMQIELYLKIYDVLNVLALAISLIIIHRASSKYRPKQFSLLMLYGYGRVCVSNDYGYDTPHITNEITMTYSTVSVAVLANIVGIT